MKHLTAADREALSEKLEAMKRNVLAELRETDAEAAQTAQGRAREVESHADAAEAASMDEVRHAEIEVDRIRLHEVEQAQHRIAEGRYGICIDCAADIPRERLLVQPTAIRCAACQSEAERKQR